MEGGQGDGGREQDFGTLSIKNYLQNVRVNSKCITLFAWKIFYP